MKKQVISVLIIGASAVTLSACSTMAQLQLQKKQLSDGSVATIAHNLPPTADWGCKQIGTPQAYNWAMLKTQGQFNIKKGPYGMLADKAVGYANQQGLKPNYINLQIPNETTFTAGYKRSSTSYNFSSAMAVASYYQCQRINPQNKIGWQKKTDTAILINADDSQMHIVN